MVIWRRRHLVTQRFRLATWCTLMAMLQLTVVDTACHPSLLYQISQRNIHPHPLTIHQNRIMLKYQISTPRTLTPQSPRLRGKQMREFPFEYSRLKSKLRHPYTFESSDWLWLPVRGVSPRYIERPFYVPWYHLFRPRYPRFAHL